MQTLPVRLPVAPDTYDKRIFNQVFQALWLRLNRSVKADLEETAATAVTSVTADYVVGLADGLVLVDTTGGNVAVTLPDATTVLGREFAVKRITAGVNTLTVTPTAGTIDGDASFTVDIQYEVHTFKSDGTNYWIISSHYGP